MFRIEDGVYYSRIFFAEIKVGRQGNIMGAIYTEPGECRWRFTYRFRWYNDDRVDRTSKDEKSWYDCVSDKPLGEVIDAARFLFAAASGAAGEHGYSELVVESDRPADVFKILSAQPWAHMSEQEAPP
jgi:hypothetical protein